MNNEIKDGGPAFPLDPEISKAFFDTPGVYQGMSLRDYFAAKVLAAVITKEGPVRGQVDEMLDSMVDGDCQRAYKYADSMLRVRGQ